MIFNFNIKYSQRARGILRNFPGMESKSTAITALFVGSIILGSRTLAMPSTGVGPIEKESAAIVFAEAQKATARPVPKQEVRIEPIHIVDVYLRGGLRAINYQEQPFLFCADRRALVPLAKYAVAVGELTNVSVYRNNKIIVFFYYDDQYRTYQVAYVGINLEKLFSDYISTHKKSYNKVHRFFAAHFNAKFDETKDKFISFYAHPNLDHLNLTSKTFSKETNEKANREHLRLFRAYSDVIPIARQMMQSPNYYEFACLNDDPA